MVWLLQLANLRSPCLGLTSNELSELLFTCIGGAIREASQFHPTNEKRPSRHVPWLHDSLWITHCAPGVGVILGFMTLKTWAEVKSKVRLWQTAWAPVQELWTPLPALCSFLNSHLLLLYLSSLLHSSMCSPALSPLFDGYILEVKLTMPASW